MHRVGEEFVRHEVVYEPAKLYVKDIYRKTYECRSCRKRGKVVMLKAGTPAPVIPHSFTSPSVLSQVITDKFRQSYATLQTGSRMEASGS